MVPSRSGAAIDLELPCFAFGLQFSGDRAGQLVKLAVRAFVVTLAEPEEIPHFLRGQMPVTAGFLLVASSSAFIARRADLDDLQRSIRRRGRESGWQAAVTIGNAITKIDELFIIDVSSAPLGRCIILHEHYQGFARRNAASEVARGFPVTPSRFGAAIDLEIPRLSVLGQPACNHAT